MRKYLSTFLASLVLLTGGFALAQETATDTPSAPTTPVVTPQPQLPQIVFPIAELGGCTSKESCRAYCADTSHQEACLAYAETHGLMKKEETQKARQFIKLKGPGGCVGQACKTYCTDEAHKDECLAFAKTNNLISKEQLKAHEDIKQNGGPGGCKSPKECREYCASEANFVECRAFAEAHGFNPPPSKPQENGGIGMMGSSSRREGPTGLLRGKIGEILAGKPGPGGCTDVDTCKTYCADKTHAEECLEFAQENGLMTKEQTDQAKKFQSMTGPGGCKGEACKDYCRDIAHLEECRQFAMQNGFMPKDAQGRMGNDPTTGVSGTPMKKMDGQMPPRPMDKPMPQMNAEQAAKMCTEKDGTWDGTRCIRPDGINAPVGAQMPPRPEGAMPSLEQMKERCVTVGGTWDGQRCFPPKPPMNAPMNGQTPPPPGDAAPTSMTPLSKFSAAVGSLLYELLK